MLNAKLPQRMSYRQAGHQISEDKQFTEQLVQPIDELSSDDGDDARLPRAFSNSIVFG